MLSIWNKLHENLGLMLKIKSLVLKKPIERYLNRKLSECDRTQLGVIKKLT